MSTYFNGVYDLIIRQNKVISQPFDSCRHVIRGCLLFFLTVLFREDAVFQSFFLPPPLRLYRQIAKPAERASTSMKSRRKKMLSSKRRQRSSLEGQEVKKESPSMEWLLHRFGNRMHIGTVGGPALFGEQILKDCMQMFPLIASVGGRATRSRAR